MCQKISFDDSFICYKKKRKVVSFYLGHFI